MIRVAGLEDVSAVAELRRTVYPFMVASVAAVTNAVRITPERAKLRWWVFEEGGELLGWARTSLSLYGDGRTADVGVTVLPGHRRRGIGTALMAEVDAHLGTVDPVSAKGWALGDPETLAWAAKYGFAPDAEARASMVDPRVLPDAPPLPADTRLVSFAEAGPEVVYELENATGPDMPGGLPMGGPMPYEDWLRARWGFVDLDKDASVVALVDGVPASYTLLEIDAPTGRAWTGMTGTRREFRGRSLGKVVKSETLRRAAAKGVTEAYTGNDATNAPMLAVNDWLGYRLVAEQRMLVKPF